MAMGLPCFFPQLSGTLLCSSFLCHTLTLQPLCFEFLCTLLPFQGLVVALFFLQVPWKPAPLLCAPWQD